MSWGQPVSVNDELFIYWRALGMLLEPRERIALRLRPRLAIIQDGGLSRSLTHMHTYPGDPCKSWQITSVLISFILHLMVPAHFSIS